MLAEPRRRQKYSLNPRGLDWSNDETKVGQRLLEKMGWRKGKALGLKEDGCKEHVKVSAKSDRKGVGCNHQQADNWIAHQEDFNSILSALNKDVNAESSFAIFSLHDKSKNSRSRVHYQKFTKGKDLSSYCATDMNCIFGERLKSVTKTEQQRINELDSESSSPNGEENRSFGVLTVTNSTSIDSYFATKLAKLRSKADKDKSISKAALQMADDSCSASDVTSDKHQKQTAQQLSLETGSEADRAVNSDVVMVKRCKKKQQKNELRGNNCQTDNKHLCCKSLDCSSKSRKKKKKGNDNDLVEVTAESNSDDQNEKTVEEAKKRKKRTSSLTVASELTVTKTLSKKAEKIEA